MVTSQEDIDAVLVEVRAARGHDFSKIQGQAKRLQRERDRLIKQLDDLRRFDEQLRHYADLRIRLGLDDGVKVNYAKVGDLLAEVKAVTGAAAD